MKAHCLVSLRRRRGAALLSALTAVMLLMIVGGAMLTTTTNSLVLADRQRSRLQAFNLAESATENAVLWLKQQGSPPSGTATIDPFGGAVGLGDGTYQVTITPDPNNAGLTLKQYVLTGTGVVQGRQMQVEVAVRQTSFGHYAYFTDREIGITGSPIWFTSRDRIRGPAHSNNAVDGSGNPTNFRVDWTGSTSPIFLDTVTSAGSSVTYNPGAPASESDFLKIYQSGSRGYQLSVDAIPLPSSTNMQQTAAWGGSTGFPTTTGAYAGASGSAMAGGIYIVGDSSVVIQRDASGNQQFVITQGSTTTTFTFDTQSGVTRRQVGAGAPQVFNGLGTGVIYSTGNITSLSGQVADNRYVQGTDPHITQRNAYTIATDVNNNKSITVTNNLSYTTQPDQTQPSTAQPNLAAGTLGLFSRNVIIGNGAPTNLTIDAVMMAGTQTSPDGSFYVNNWSSKTPTGTLHVLGGIIQKARGPVGTFSGSTIQTGYAKDYYYDPRLADDPPPFFPTTGNYDRISWRRLPGA